MFEKEAEEYAIENYETCLYDDLPYTNDSKAIEQAFENGAEFGYNKAFVEADKNLKAILTDFNKANEWHYVKDELPNEGTYLVVRQNDKGYKEIFILNYEEDDKEELHWVDDDCEVQDEYVIAWKEIVFPKEIKK